MGRWAFRFAIYDGWRMAPINLSRVSTTARRHEQWRSASRLYFELKWRQIAAFRRKWIHDCFDANLARREIKACQRKCRDRGRGRYAKIGSLAGAADFAINLFDDNGADDTLTVNTELEITSISIERFVRH